MDIAALLLACSVHADDALLSSIAYVYGGGNPYAVVEVSLQALEQDDATLVVTSRSSTAARAEVERIIASGGEPVLGLLPVRPEWAMEFGKTLADLFEPCGDIAIASAKLSEFDYACRGRGAQRSLRRRGCTLELYGRSLGLPALRQAALADLTLPGPFPSDTESSESTWISTTLQADSSIFFGTHPPDRVPSLASESRVLPLEERQ